MPAEPLLLALDQGTTSTRAILFDRDGKPAGAAQRELPQIYPADGWVEHDPEEIWRATTAVMAEALAAAGRTVGDVAAVGITNQRETSVLWERRGGRPVHNAIVWQDRRGAPLCRELAAAGHAPLIRSRTGLLVDSYFSATKIRWLLDNVAGARAAAERGELAFGTIDSFLLWRLTGGRVHATDATNASRTMLYDIHAGRWDPELLELLRVPAAILPEVKDCAGAFGNVDPAILGRRLPIAGVAGDQQAALVGQACLEPGMIKSTYGTGCFVLLHSGRTVPRSANRLVATIAYRLEGETSYASEGSIFVAGAAIQWLRDKLKLVATAAESAALAASIESTNGVYLVPAFTGLGAPYWDPDARGLIAGLTRDSGPAEIVRAALEAVCYQTRDLVEAMAEDGAGRPQALRVDGGMAANDWLMQFLADQLDIPVERPVVTETTALGAAYLAGLGVGLYRDPAEIARRWRRERRFEPTMRPERRDALYAGWKRAVERALASRG
jgi:glycerol kinase